MKSPTWALGLTSAWLLLCLVLGVFVFNKGIHVDTRLQALLPASSQDPVIHAIDANLAALGEGQLSFVLEGTSKHDVHKAAEDLANTLCKSDRFDCVQSDEAFSSFIEALKDYRVNLLSSQDQYLMQKPHALFEKKFKRLFALNNTVTFLSIEADPFGFFNDAVTSTLHNLTEYAQEDGFYSLPLVKDKYAAFLSVSLADNTKGMHQQAENVHYIDTVIQKLQHHYSKISIYRSGALFHSVKAAEQAKKEVSAIGFVSIAGIVLLFILSGIGLSGLLGTLFVLGVAMMAGFIICQIFFQSVHIITLVFAMSLLGIGVDYAIHLFCVRKSDSSLSVLIHALTVSAISTCLGFALLAESDLLLLKQIAVFVVAGLLTVYLLTLTLLVRWPLSKRPLIKANPLEWVAQISKRYRFPVFCSLFVAIMLSAFMLVTAYQPMKDLRGLIKLDDKLALNEKAVQARLNTPSFSQYVLVTGDTEAQLLERLQLAERYLEDAVRGGSLLETISIADLIPPPEIQARNKAFQLAFLSKYLGEFYQRLGVKISSDDLIQQLEAQAELSPMVLKDTFPAPFNTLIGSVDNQLYSVILLKGLQSNHSLKLLNLEGVRFVDKVSGWSRALASQQRVVHSQFFLILGVLAFFILMVFKHIKSLSIVLVPGLSALFTFALLVSCGVSVSVFHSFALFLILGLGIDYGVFSYTAGQEVEQTAAKAIFLSMLTTLLAFGLLSLSQVPMIQGMGLTLLLGIIFNALLSQVLIYEASHC